MEIETVTRQANTIVHNKNPSPYKVIDVDTHFSEPPDLWTSRVSGKYKTLMPHQVGDKATGYAWMVNNNDVLRKPAGASSCIHPDGSKSAVWDHNIEKGRHVSEVHPASYDPMARVEFMNETGIWAQILYPNIVGFASLKLMNIDRQVSQMVISVYNDAMAEIQEKTKRLFPMALLPFWDVQASAKEVRRAAGMGLRGVTMCQEPHASGLPDLIDHHWDPLWEACTEHKMPINFHVGSGEDGMALMAQSAWPSLDWARKHVVACAQLEMHNARTLTNLLASDLLVRFPETKWVSVESGIGWIPYILERLEYQFKDSSADGKCFGQPMPRELFQRQCYGCFWFEEAGPEDLLKRIGFDNVLFETDFPHPTCLYPNAVEHAMKVLAKWGPEVQRKILQDNASKLYNIPV